MPWWKHLWKDKAATSSSEHRDMAQLALEGWREGTPQGDLRVWRNSQDDVLSLAISDAASLRFPEVANEAALRQWSRECCEDRGAGLIEIRVGTGARGAIVGFISKRLVHPAYLFTGMLFMPHNDAIHVWTAVSGERGITGVREALITAELWNAGVLTPENFELCWAADPYDHTYHGVDRSVLRFVSDDPCYDERFPDHPLSKVRRLLDILPDSVTVGSKASDV
jgi:hypothetical protein